MLFNTGSALLLWIMVSLLNVCQVQRMFALGFCCCNISLNLMKKIKLNRAESVTANQSDDSRSIWCQYTAKCAKRSHFRGFVNAPPNKAQWNILADIMCAMTNGSHLIQSRIKSERKEREDWISTCMSWVCLVERVECIHGCPENCHQTAVP